MGLKNRAGASSPCGRAGAGSATWRAESLPGSTTWNRMRKAVAWRMRKIKTTTTTFRLNCEGVGRQFSVVTNNVNNTCLQVQDQAPAREGQARLPRGRGLLRNKIHERGGRLRAGQGTAGVCVVRGGMQQIRSEEGAGSF